MTQLNSLADARMGKTILAKELSSAGVPVFSAGQANEPWGFIAKSDLLFDNRTVVLSARGSIGFPKLPKQLPFVSTQTTIAVQAQTPELALYLRYWLDTVDWTAETSGATIPMLTVRQVADFLVPLPPLAEQKRIVAKVEALLARVNAARDRLAKTPTILKRFRQSVLAAACSGRLTEEWRVAHPDVESGSLLIRRIQKARLSAAVSSKERNQIAEAFQPEMLEVAEDELAIQAIPEWAPCRIGAIGTVVNGSTPSRKQDEFWDGDIPWVSSGEVRNNNISTTRERITKAGYEGSSVRLLPPGTVLVAMIGEGKTRGQSAILQISATINQNIAAILLSHGLVSSEFLWRWLQFQYELTRERGGGSGPQALNCQSVRELPFLLPPLAEQHEIVRRVEELFSLADAVEKNVAKGTERTEKLIQAILAKAFSGELVAQDPNDEPASIMLDRIRIARTAATKTQTKQGRTTRTTMSTKPTVHTVKKIIYGMPSDRFSFEDLRGQVPGDYESLKDVLFELLSEVPASIKQVFDVKARAMQLVKVKQ